MLIRWLAFLILTTAIGGASTEKAMEHWQKRDQRPELEKALELFEAAIKSNPSDREAITLFVRGSFLLANAHLKEKSEKKKILQKARNLGDQTLKIDTSDLSRSLERLTKADVPLIYWTMSNLGYLSEVNGILSSIGNKRQITEMLERVSKLDPEYFYGAVPRFWGAYYAVVPRIAGGNMKKSRKEFEKAIQLGPDFLTNKTLMAELFWTRDGDRKEFERMLNEVLKAEVNNPEIAPENNLEKLRAHELLKAADDLF